MALSISASGIRGILLDIEGTTTPISFVYDVLFPFARRELDQYFRANETQTGLQEILVGLQRDHEVDSRAIGSVPEWRDPPVAYVHWLMDLDRKSTALKTLQGLIWEDGYRAGRLRGRVFLDVVPALERWRTQSLDVRIFSSGSELAQRLLFGNSESGDLTSFIRGYFDTTIGSKSDPLSYRRISLAFGLAPREIAFISDVVRELDAAREAGMVTLLCVRPGNHPQAAHSHQMISSFDEIDG